MELTEQPELTQLVRKLWVGFFPSRETAPGAIARTVANKDWMRDSLVFYGWLPKKDDTLSINMKFIDGGCVLYLGQDICAVASVNWSGPEPTLKITYVDNRPQ